MNPSSLLNVPSDLMRQHAGHVTAGCPMAGIEDRRWAVVVFLGAVALAVIATVIVVLH